MIFRSHSYTVQLVVLRDGDLVETSVSAYNITYCDASLREKIVLRGGGDLIGVTQSQLSVVISTRDPQRSITTNIRTEMVTYKSNGIIDSKTMDKILYHDD